MNPLTMINDLIREHGSASILRDHLNLLREQIVTLQQQLVSLQRELSTKTSEVIKLTEQVNELNATIDDLKKKVATFEESQDLLHRTITPEQQTLLMAMLNDDIDLGTAARLIDVTQGAAKFHLTTLEDRNYAGAICAPMSEDRWFIHQKGREYLNNSGLLR